MQATTTPKLASSGSAKPALAALFIAAGVAFGAVIGMNIPQPTTALPGADAAAALRVQRQGEINSGVNALELHRRGEINTGAGAATGVDIHSMVNTTVPGSRLSPDERDELNKAAAGASTIGAGRSDSGVTIPTDRVGKYDNVRGGLQWWPVAPAVEHGMDRVQPE